MAFRQDYIPSDHRFCYRADESCEGGGLFVEVWLPPKRPSGGKTSVALQVSMIHGGGFWSGEATLLPWNQVAYCLDKGIAVVSPEYRLLPHAKMRHMREDCLDAYRYLQGAINEDLRKTGTSIELDGTKVSTMGWSAGGTLCLYLGVDVAKEPGLPPLKAVMLSYALSDFAAQAASNTQSYKEMLASNSTVADAVASLLSGKVVSHAVLLPPELPAGSWVGKPFPWLQNRVTMFGATVLSGSHHIPELLLEPDDALGQPLSLVDSSFPPTFILVAEKDDMFDPRSQSYSIAQRFGEIGVEVVLRVAETMLHGQGEHWALFPAWTEKQASDWWPITTEGLDFCLER